MRSMRGASSDSMNKQLVRFEKNHRYGTFWARFEAWNLPLENREAIQKFASELCTELKRNVNSESTYATLDRPQPFWVEIVNDCLIVTTSGGTKATIPDRDIVEILTGIIEQEIQGWQHLTPSLVGGPTTASYVIGLHNCLLGRTVSMNERHLPLFPTSYL